MVDLPHSLEAVYTAPLRERNDSYLIEIPKREVEYDTVSAGEVCRVALIDRISEASDDADSDSGATSEPSDLDPDGPPVAEDEIREVAIQSLGDQGDGIAKVGEGYACRAERAVRGSAP